MKVENQEYISKQKLEDFAMNCAGGCVNLEQIHNFPAEVWREEKQDEIQELKEKIKERVAAKLGEDIEICCKQLLTLARTICELERNEFMKSMYGSLAGGKLETCCCEKENSNGE